MLLSSFVFLLIISALSCIQTHTTTLHIYIHNYYAVLRFIYFRKTSTLPTMASSSNPKKTTKRAAINKVEQVDNSEDGYLERWFSGMKRVLRTIIVK